MDRDGNRFYGGRLFVVVMLSAAGIAAILAYRYVFVQDQIDRNRTALVALCVLRHDLDQRIAGSRAFIREHPHGIPGIPSSLIHQSLRNSERTRDALNVLDCKSSS